VIFPKMDLEIRDLESHDEFLACLALQEVVWGPGFDERVPSAILKLAHRFGGVVAGAFARGGSGLLGFVFGLTVWERGEPVHWSDLLAVHPEVRKKGVGRALKMHQRKRLLAQGVRTVYWSFDPLEAANAHLNLNLLGARVGEYVVDLYGPSTSPLHAGLGTDRFIARWDLDSPGVEQRQKASPFRFPELRGVEVLAGDLDSPSSPRLGESGGPLRVSIPADIQTLKREDLPLAARWRQATREVFQFYLGQGWEVQALLPSPHPGGMPQYLLVPESASRAKV